MWCHFLKEKEQGRGLRRKATRKTNTFDFKKINVCVYFVKKNENVCPFQKPLIFHWKEGRKKETEVPHLLIVLGKVSKSNTIFLPCSTWYPPALCPFADIRGREVTLLSPLPRSGDYYSPSVIGPCLTTPPWLMCGSSRGSPALQPGALHCSSMCLYTPFPLTWK